MVELLALPTEETEKFIAAKAAENNPVEEMTIKNLRDEVAKLKANYEQKKSEVENLFHENENLKSENVRLLRKFLTIMRTQNQNCRRLTSLYGRTKLSAGNRHEKIHFGNRSSGSLKVSTRAKRYCRKAYEFAISSIKKSR